MPCQSINDLYDASSQTVSYHCTGNGSWQNLDTSKCSFVSDTTRILEGFSKVNSSIMESARHLKEYTGNISIFRDVMDLVYTIKTMESYSSLLINEPLDNILMDIANNLLNLQWQYLRRGDKDYKTCGKLLDVVENLAWVNPGVLFIRVSQYNF